MIKKIKAYLISMAAILTLIAPTILAPVIVKADTITQPGLNCGSNGTVPTGGISSGSCPTPSDQNQTINNTIKLVINLFSFVVGIIAVIMIIVGGIRFVLSGGDSAATGSARNTVLYAVIGLVVVALAQIIVHFVLNRTNSVVTSP